MLHHAGCFAFAQRPARLVFAIVATFLLIASLSHSAQSQTYSVIHNFTGGQDGGQPAAGPALDASGNLYGTAFYGGSSNNGAVYKLTHHNSSWVLSPLYSFTAGGDGAHPEYGAVTLGPDGSPYGTTSSGALGEAGTVFSVRPRPTACASTICAWMDNTVHQFGTGNDGIQPLGSVVFDAAGKMSGTTFLGGASGMGTVFEAMPSGTENVIYNFAGGSDGANPVAGLTFDSAGNLYGTTYGGGANGWGTIFKLSPSGSGWTKTVIYNFQNANDGRAPAGGVIFDQAGNLYGGTAFGGANSGGVVYELSPSGANWTLTTLYSFSGVAGPYNNLTFDASGNLYGTTYRDGANLVGSVFKLTQSAGNWTFTDLYDFTNGNDGGYPTSSVAADSQADVFGTASSGGTSGQGVVFEITP
ncbi:MAG: choice-of-anchor tandem repeat GloVer-containing protein [Candidatus Korobacteraceae bacterium]|jgi:uncharacterized repeat protein (TIGR03803 family)